jgi:glycosyltransferase involved in cell wall biosynthesis
VARAGIRSVTACYIVLLRAAVRFGRTPRQIPDEGAEILLTGTFYSDNWVRSHIKPLADSAACKRLRIVATNPVPAVDNVEAIYPPVWLLRTIGRVPARLLVFAWVAVRTRPHVVGAFHLLFNGLVASLLARVVGARALYFCVGGPSEVLNGGLMSENRFYSKLQTPDPLVERWLIEAVSHCGLIVTMGARAAEFFRSRGVTTHIEVISGGIDGTRFLPGTAERPFDAVLVARLAPIKRIDLFVRAMAELRKTVPAACAVIVGDGALRADLERLVEELGLAGHVTFAGHQTDIAQWLQRAKVFVLTSESEGLALSLMEAMTCGLPAVVPRVGDLGELVTNGVNGFLVAERQPEAYSARLAELLCDPARYASFAEAARRAAERYDAPETSRRWNRVFSAGTSHGPAEWPDPLTDKSRVLPRP